MGTLVLRDVIGSELRRARLEQGRTLREVATAARVSLGYLSEVERGQKEASSELLAAICSALDVPMSTLLRTVSDTVAVHEGVVVAAGTHADVTLLSSARATRAAGVSSAA